MVVRASRLSFKPIRRKNGGFGHSSAKYSKNPKLQHNRNIEGNRSKSRIRIESPSSSVHEAIDLLNKLK